jgi:hypothetical protein
MKFERRHAALLLGVAVWNVVTFGMFARNLWAAYDSGEDRATGYWVAHSILIIVNGANASLKRPESALVHCSCADSPGQNRCSCADSASGRGGGRRGGPS